MVFGSCCVGGYKAALHTYRGGHAQRHGEGGRVHQTRGPTWLRQQHLPSGPEGPSSVAGAVVAFVVVVVCC